MISIILPVLNEAKLIAQRADEFNALRQQGCELIAVDGGSTDDSFKHLQSCCDHVLSHSKGRAKQMNAGAAQAKGRVLVFLHIDTILPENGLSEISKGINERPWGRFDVSFSPNSLPMRLIAWSMNQRSRLTHVSTGDQAMFFDSCFFDALGGFPDLPLMEDVAISKLARTKAKPVSLRTKVTTSSRRWQTHGVIKTVLLMWRLRLQFFLGTSAEKLRRQYYPDA